MIITVTPDAVLDRVLFIESWQPGRTMRASKTTTSVGGKGLDASLALVQLDVPSVALAFLAGETGHNLLELTQQYGIDVHPTWTGGETRTAHVIAEVDRHSHIFSGELQVSPTHLEQLLDDFHTLLPQSDWVICGGLVPQTVSPAFFKSLVEKAAAQGVPTLVDSFQEYMRETIAAQPAIAKLNWHEFERTFECEAATIDDLKEQGRQVQTDHALPALVVTCEADGILAFTGAGNYHARPPRLDAVNATGAGDAASAALAWRLALGDSWTTALHWATAVSAASVLCENTAEFRQADVELIFSDVEVIRL